PVHPREHRHQHDRHPRLPRVPATQRSGQEEEVMSDEKKPDEKKPSSELAVRVNTVRGWLEAQKPELARVLGKDGNVERFARIARTCALRKLETGACPRQSFALAVMEAAQLGLELDSVSGMAYLVPFKGVVTLIPGYRGLIQLAYRHPKVVEITPH